MTQEVCCVQSFKDYRVLVGKQVFQQCIAVPCKNYERLLAEEMKKIKVTAIIMYPEAFALKGPGTGPPVTEAVKYDSCALLLK
jgi:hypothetical protein